METCQFCNFYPFEHHEGREIWTQNFYQNVISYYYYKMGGGSINWKN